MIAIDYSNKKEKSYKFKNFLNMSKIMQVFAKTIASDLVSVKPFEPIGKVFYTDFALPYYWKRPRRCIILIN